MAPKVFITGTTGFIAGDILYALTQKHPDWPLTLLIRTEAKANQVRKAYPNARIVLGDLDSSDLLKDEASKTDIVIHAADASDHVGAAKAIAEGLAAGHSKEKPGFWLHTGGTGILTYFDTKSGRTGEWEEKQFDDWEGVEEMTSLPDEAFHRDVDKIVLEAGEREGVKTAILCPGTIYGKGRGPVSGRSRQAYELAKFVLTNKYTPIIGQGKARWNNIHVHDLADLYVLLAEAAANKNLDTELWGEKGYYFAENGEHVWGDFTRLVSKKAEELGYANGLQEKPLEKDAALKKGFEVLSWGLNSRSKAIRARKLLGWKPHRPSIEDEAENILKDEKERLG